MLGHYFVHVHFEGRTPSYIVLKEERAAKDSDDRQLDPAVLKVLYSDTVHTGWAEYRRYPVLGHFEERLQIGDHSEVSKTITYGQWTRLEYSHQLGTFVSPQLVRKSKTQLAISGAVPNKVAGWLQGKPIASQSNIRTSPYILDQAHAQRERTSSIALAWKTISKILYLQEKVEGELWVKYQDSKRWIAYKRTYNGGFGHECIIDSDGCAPAVCHDIYWSEELKTLISSVSHRPLVRGNHSLVALPKPHGIARPHVEAVPCRHQVHGRPEGTVDPQ